MIRQKQIMKVLSKTEKVGYGGVDIWNVTPPPDDHWYKFIHQHLGILVVHHPVLDRANKMRLVLNVLEDVLRPLGLPWFDVVNENNICARFSQGQSIVFVTVSYRYVRIEWYLNEERIVNSRISIRRLMRASV